MRSLLQSTWKRVVLNSRELYQKSIWRFARKHTKTLVVEIEEETQKSKMALPREGDPTTAAFGGYERSEDVVEIGAMSPDQPTKGKKKSLRNDLVPELFSRWYYSTPEKF